MNTPQDKVPNSAIYNGNIEREKIQKNEIKYNESYGYSSNNGGSQHKNQKDLQHYRKTNIYLSKRPSFERKWSQEKHLMTCRNDLTKTTTSKSHPCQT